MLTILVQQPGQAVRELTSVEETRVALRDPRELVWIDFDCRSAESDALLSEVFGFHPLAIEDVYKDGHAPKVEDYGRYLYLVVQALSRDRDHDLAAVPTTELDLFVGPDFVVTHHAGPLSAVEAVRASLCAGKTAALGRGPSFLAHALLDAVVDRFAPLADELEREVDALEVRVLRSTEEAEAGRILELTRSLHQLRRLALHQREVLERLAAGRHAVIAPEARPFFRDVHEHLKDFGESLETMREDLTSIFRAYHSLSAQRMGAVIKVLTLLSTILLPLNFVAAIYGMNFARMPELRWEHGYPFALGLMAFIAGSMLLVFRARRWI